MYDLCHFVLIKMFFFSNVFMRPIDQIFHDVFGYIVLHRGVEQDFSEFTEAGEYYLVDGPPGPAPTREFGTRDGQQQI